MARATPATAARVTELGLKLISKKMTLRLLAPASLMRRLLGRLLVRGGSQRFYLSGFSPHASPTPAETKANRLTHFGEHHWRRDIDAVT